MSGSPSYAEIQLRRAEELRLAEERRRKAEEERRRREEAERRARIELANRLRVTLAEEAERLQDDLVQLRLAAAKGRLAGAVPHLEPKIALIVASASGGPETVSAALGKIRAAAAVTRNLSSTLQKQDRAVAAAQDELSREAAEEAARLSASVGSSEATRQHQAIEASESLRARIIGIEADEVAMTWSGDDVRAVADAIATVQDAPRPQDAAQDLNRRLDAALDRAQERQLVEERRAYVVASLQQGLREQGFHVGDATLVGSTIEGEVAFRAVRADRRWVDVNVPLTGHVFYDVDGTDRVTEQGTDGSAYTRCDETEARLDALHADLDARFGIEAGELLWEAKDPNRVRRNANALPTGGPAATRTKG